MHVNKSRLGGELLPSELKHISNCAECAYEHEILDCLIKEAEDIKLISPPMSDWLAIQSKTTKKKKRHKALFGQVSFVIAASTFFLVAGWLLRSNFLLQNQLEQLLLVNSNLEYEISLIQAPIYNQTRLIYHLSGLEEELLAADSNKKKLSVLEKRQELIEQYLIDNKGGKYEFSI